MNKYEVVIIKENKEEKFIVEAESEEDAMDMALEDNAIDCPDDIVNEAYATELKREA